ncbi:hypothetical protein YPPY98_0940, partial [Yersinia pestis PY-98]
MRSNALTGRGWHTPVAAPPEK